MGKRVLTKTGYWKEGIDKNGLLERRYREKRVIGKRA